MLLVRLASHDTHNAAGFSIGPAIGGLVIVSAVCFSRGAWLTTGFSGWLRRFVRSDDNATPVNRRLAAPLAFGGRLVTLF